MYRPEARLAFDPQPDAGPVLVTVDYTIAPDRQAAFLDAMQQVRRSRLRTGGTSWELYQDGEHPDHFVEIFKVPSWDEHQRQDAERLTWTDRQLQEQASRLSDPPARVGHLLPPQAQR